MASNRQTQYIFVTGGVMSGLGKGITAASIGKILKSAGFSVNIQKCDPYLNTDAGTLNPSEHGEVFVTADGAETDLDLGHYERFLDQELTRKCSLMSGNILSQVIADERAGRYLGETVQIIPHVTEAIQDGIEDSGEGFDVHIVEIGGTVGDYESLSFFEAIREFKYRVGPENVLYVNLVYLPYLMASKELKTKPAQNAVRSLRSVGISPDVLIARADYPANEAVVEKLSMFCDVEPAGIVTVPTVDCVYRVPLVLEEAGLGKFIMKKLDINHRSADLADWEKLVNRITKDYLEPIRIGVAAKYMAHEDTYMSVFEAIQAAAWEHEQEAEIVWIDAEELEKKANFDKLAQVDGLVVPGGFGDRGIEGKIMAANYAIENNKPYLGLCLGMQVGVIALARRALAEDANSMEFDENTKHPVISLMADQEDITEKGGTMRLGNYPCELDQGSKSYQLYGQEKIYERHRHRFEFNNAYRERLGEAGLVLAGISPDEKLVELIELAEHPFFIGSQFHPEFNSRPNRPHPLFRGFMKAAVANKE